MWQSVTDAELAAECWSAIGEIESCLVAHLESNESRDPLLASGDSGLALFFAYLSAARPDSPAGDRALEALSRSLDGLAAMQLLPALLIGYSGIGWVVEHLTRDFFEGDDDLATPIDDALETLLHDVNDAPPYELVGGLVGIGTYLIERLPHPRAARTLTRILDLLEMRAEHSRDGITWFTPAEWLANWQREQMPHGCYNLGVAHGVPGIIGFLAAAKQEGFDDARIETLAAGAVRWLRAQRIEADQSSLYGAWLVPGKPLETTRTAWCYGDIGVAAVLLRAARAFDRKDWEDEALSVARAAATRPAERTLAIDPGLCHGAVGNAHLFNRFYQATREPLMKEAALEWYRRALAMRRPGEGLAGLLTWINPVGREGFWKGEYGFLSGISGFALAMLAAVTDVEPKWDRVMLVAVPPKELAA
ncbi:MAG TPA: lanthionine synthetase C family protein [Thermoanaerobaculia bacterium]|nr:lanthionine synthetase C family protein [Thermoanaerobaculia bacterium]